MEVYRNNHVCFLNRNVSLYRLYWQLRPHEKTRRRKRRLVEWGEEGEIQNLDARIPDFCVPLYEHLNLETILAQPALYRNEWGSK